MALGVSVSDRQFTGQVQQALDSLRRIGCDKANTLYILTTAELVNGALSLPTLKLLQATQLAPSPGVKLEDGAALPRLVSKLLEDKASHDVAFKLAVDLLP